ncbi:acyl--CoA ligase [Pseudonocardia sp. KRD-169]|uniref:Acyl--CoA ligase n=1 Tax=Pseudonocardia abyssalis TaxID=2792008 RepID=A0ABS6USP1_9PSEU|nr:acyl--CoA ligase [Pseudonocardia abyssalis]MBW0134759.1 acyl--CoA ligase [Pseudonocardia abyssalis]
MMDVRGDVSWEQLARRVARLATGLGRAGIGSGDVVVTLLSGSRECVELALACARVGAVIAPLGHGRSAPELGRVMELAGPRLFVTDDELSDLVAEARDGAAVDFPVVRVGRRGPDGYDALLADTGDLDGYRARIRSTDPLWMVVAGGPGRRPSARFVSHRALEQISPGNPAAGAHPLVLGAIDDDARAFRAIVSQLAVGGTVVLPRAGCARRTGAVVPGERTEVG